MSMKNNGMNSFTHVD